VTGAGEEQLVLYREMAPARLEARRLDGGAPAVASPRRAARPEAAS
jgi:hypothetical protein